MKIVLSILLSLISLLGFGQFGNSNPVSWSFSAKKTGNKIFEVHFTATIGGNYHMYAQSIEGDGPIPTAFTFAKNPLLNLQAPVKEIGRKITKYEEVWKIKVSYFENKVDFVKVVRSKVAAPTSLKGSVEFMVCDDKQCKPPKTVAFDIKLGN